MDDESFGSTNCSLMTNSSLTPSSKQKKNSTPAASILCMGGVLPIAMWASRAGKLKSFYTLRLQSIWASKTLKLDAFESHEGDIYSILNTVYPYTFMLITFF